MTTPLHTSRPNATPDNANEGAPAGTAIDIAGFGALYGRMTGCFAFARNDDLCDRAIPSAVIASRWCWSNRPKERY